MKEIYAIEVVFTNINGERNFAVSTQAYQNIDDAKGFISERADTIWNDGWYGRQVSKDDASKTEYFIHALRVEGGK